MNKPTQRRRRVSRLKIGLQFGFLAFVLGGVGLGVAALYQVTRRLPTMEELGTSSAATRIYSADGILLARIYQENRDYVRLKDIPRTLQDATVAIEDDRFFSHSGLDMRGIGRALVSNVRGGRLGQGGSTITQQLARNAYDLGKQKTFGRKLQEAVVAMRLERRYSKQEILEGYLNEVYYGAKAYGVQAAALEYFGKPAKKLTLSESALIAGLPQRPTEFNPYKNPDAAKQRRDTVLARMAELGYITPHESRLAQRDPIRLATAQQDKANDWKAPYFVDYVLRQLDNRYGADQVARGGLEVHTSLIWSMQQAAERAVRDGLVSAAQRGLVGRGTQAALTCVDPHNGLVRAMVGGKTWGKSQFNRAISNTRQPGSSFKLFVYTVALNNGWDQWHVVMDTPKSWRQATGKWWTPRNDDNRYHGAVSLHTAMAQSINVPAIKTAETFGIGKAIGLARKLGLKGNLPPYLATAIGAGGASTLEMAGAYGAYSVKGQYVAPVAITQVRDREGNTLEEASPNAEQVVDPDVVNEMDDMLRAVVTEGTGRAAGVVPDAFGKTGTTQDDRDAWFVGFTPQLSTAVWVGNDDYTPMRHAYGGKACAPIWVDFMEKALQLNPKSRPDVTNTTPKEPANGGGDTQDVATDANGMVSLKICPDSGLIATNHCPHWHTQKFRPEDAPKEACDVHPGTALSHVSATTDEKAAPRPAVYRTPPTDTGGSDDPAPAAPSAPTPRPAAQSAPAPPPTSVAQAAYETVTLCADTGLRANADCPRTITRRLLASAVPAGVCRLHGPGNP